VSALAHLAQSFVNDSTDVVASKCFFALNEPDFERSKNETICLPFLLTTVLFCGWSDKASCQYFVIVSDFQGCTERSYKRDT